MLALEGLCEMIVVNDRYADDTVEVCAQFDDARLRLVTHSRNLGVAAARNTGVANSRGSWVLFGEDDCRFPPDYAVVLRDVADREAADMVGTPDPHVRDRRGCHQFAHWAPRSARPPLMDEDGVFPTVTMQTPFLPARVLVRRSVFETVSFYEKYPGNAYREETDFFVQAARGGFRCVLTPDTYCYQLDSFSGGQHHSSPLRYEYWTLRNNWTFLRRHGSWLSEEGYIDSEVSAQARFVLRRLRVVSTGMLRARLRRLRAAREHGHT